MFIGRVNEKNKIESFIKGGNHTLLVYGKRRVGKTELIKQSLKGFKYVYFECNRDSFKYNVDNFIQTLVSYGYLSKDYEATSFLGVFTTLDMMKEEITIVFDEYNYLYEYEDNRRIDSQFQNIIDNHLSNIKLIVCGSNVAIMSSLLDERNALFVRFDEIIHLGELNYQEAQYFYPNKTIYDKIAFYSVFGGSPFLNRMIMSENDLESNIKNLFLDEDSTCFQYCERLLLTDVPKSININGICTILKNGKKTCAEIENLLDTVKNGGMNKKLDLLTSMGFINKYQPINKLGNFKTTRYELNDNAVRFFYTFIYPNKSYLKSIGRDRFYNECVRDKITTFIAHRFEEIVREYFSIAVKDGKYENVINIGTFYYNNSVEKTNGEFDVALKLKNEKYKIVEVKYYKNRLLSVEEMEHEIEQVKKIKELNIDSVSFVSTSGYEDDSRFETIPVDELYV